MAKLINREIMANTSLDDHTVDLIVGAFFFDMRSCEYVHTPTPGRTKVARPGCLIFRDSQKPKDYTTQPSKTTTSKQIYYRGIRIPKEQRNNGLKNPTEDKSKASVAMVMVLDVIVHAVLRKGKGRTVDHHIEFYRSSFINEVQYRSE